MRFKCVKCKSILSQIAGNPSICPVCLQPTYFTITDELKVVNDPPQMEVIEL